MGARPGFLTYQVGMKVRAGGATFFIIDAADPMAAGAEALRRATARGYDVTAVISCTEQRQGPNMLTAPFLRVA